MIQMIERSCAVTDLQQFEAAQQINVLQLAGVNAAASRRLLTFGLLDLLFNAIGLHDQAYDLADLANRKADGNTASIQNIANNLGTVQTNLGLVNQTLQVQEQELHLLQSANIITSQSIANLIASGNATDIALQILRQNTANGFTQITADLNTAQAYFANVVSQQSTAAAAGLALLSNRMVELQNLLDTETNSLFQATENNGDNLIAITSQLYDEVRKTNLRHLLTSMFFDSVKTITSQFIPLISDPGIAPLNGGVLSGPDTRLLVETIDIRYVTAVASGGGNVYSIVSDTIRFYIDADYAIAHQTPFMTINSLMKLFGPSGCRRPYISSGPGDDPDGQPCIIWAEVTKTQCFGQINLANPTQFDWATANPSLPPSKQTNVFLNAYCNAAPFQALPTAVPVIKSMTDLVNFLGSECSNTIHNKFQFRTYRGQQIGYFPPVNASLCTQTWQQQINAALAVPTLGISTLVTTMTFLQGSYQLILPDVINAEMKKFGVLPGGLTFDDLPFIYTPPSYTSTGEPVYQGGATPHECIQAYWAAAHSQTVCAYAAQLMDPPNAVSKQIVIDIEGPPCTDPTGATCYPVGTSSVSSNLLLASDFNPDTSFIIMGNINEAAKRGIWDAPDSLLQYSNNPLNDANKLSYYSMPPNTDTTWDLSTWQNANGHLFDPRSASASLGEYRFDAIFDSDGFPMCAVPGGVSPGSVIGSNYTFAQRGCVAPFSVFSTDLQEQSLGTATASGTGLSNIPIACQPIASNGRVLYQSYALELNTSTLGGVDPASQLFRGGSSYAVMYWYKMTNSISVTGGGSVLVLSVSDGASDRLQFGNDQFGEPYVLRSNSFDSRTATFNIDIRDSIWHQVLWQISFSNGNIVAQLYVDGISQTASPLILGSWSSASFTQFDLLTASISSSVYQLTFYSGASLVDPDVYHLYVCSQAWMNSRCTSGKTTEKIFMAMQNITGVSSVQCISSSQLIQATPVFDVDYPPLPPVDPLDSSWSISFWFRSHSGQVLNIRGVHGSVTATLSGSSLVIIVNGVATFSAPDVLDSEAHFFVVTYNAGIQTAVAWMDNFQLGSSATNVAALSSSSYALSATVWMIKLYSTALTPAQVSTEMNCVFDSTRLDRQDYLPPIGYCAIDMPYSTTKGYCRHPMMCNGHCSAFSTIDQSTGTFVASLNECDDGWSAPECVTPCSRIDDTTGQCLSKIQTVASGLIPNGKWCQLLKHFQVSADENTHTLTLTSRFWVEEAQLSVPSGTVTQVINSGGCPVTKPNALSSSTFSISMVNQGNLEIQLKAILLPDNVFNPPPGTPAVACRLPCCNLLGADVIIPAFSSFPYNLPDCGLMTVVLQIPASINNGNQASNCSVYTGTMFRQAFEQASASNIDVNTQLAIATAQSETNALLANTLTDVFLQMMNLLIIQANISGDNGAFAQLLLAQKEQLAQTSFNPTAIAGNFTNPFNLNDGITELLASSQQNLQQANDGLSQQTAINQQLNGLNVQLNTLAGERGANLIQLQAGLVSLQNSIYATLNLTENHSGSISLLGFISDVASAAGTAASAVVTTAAHAGSTILDDGLNLLGVGSSGIGSLFSGLLKTLVYVAVIVLVVYIAYKLFTSKWLRDQFKSKPKKERGEGEPEPKTKPSQQDPGTSGQCNVTIKKNKQRGRPPAYRQLRTTEEEEEDV